jgi:hypothetical protein
MFWGASTRRLSRLAMAAGLWMGCSQGAMAFSDPSTGFGVRPIAGYTVEATSARRQFDVGVGLNPIAERPGKAGTGSYVCEVGFKAAAANAGLSKAEINALVGKVEWLNLMRASIELAFNVTAVRRFTLDGFRGVEFEATPKMGPGAADVRVFGSIVETARGRVTQMCVTVKDDYRRALPQFRAIRAGITLPQ